MNWLFVGLSIAVVYLVWFGYLLFKKNYDQPLLYFALAHIPYLLVNLVAPIRAAFDSGYAGYSMGWLELSKGLWVALVIGAIVISCLLLASRALQNKMNGLWLFAFIFDLGLSVMIAFPLLLDVLTDLTAFTIELGEYLKVSGIWVSLIIFCLFTGPTFWACYFAGKKVFRQEVSVKELA